MKEALKRAADAVIPMEQVAGVPYAYWCQMTAPYLRWVRPEDEDDVVNALARLQAKREIGFPVADGQARFLGMFRAAGLTVPVWQLPDGVTAVELAEPLQKFAVGFEEALAASGPLDADARRAKAGIVSRQVTLR
jgi:hypothetical protein